MREMPNIVREAMACKLKIFTRNVGDVNKYKKFVIIINDEPKEIANKILKYIFKSSLVKKNYNLESISSTSIKKKIIKLYNRMVSK